MMNNLFEITRKLKNGIFTSKRINMKKNLIFFKILTFLTILAIFASDEERFCANF